MASTLPFPKLVEFGYMLCGTYTLNPNAQIPNDREPLTTTNKIRRFIERMKQPKGKRAALAALDLLVENSASPRETKTSLLLTFPTRLGGYGFPKAELNVRFDIDASEKNLFEKDYVVLDLYWPDFNFGIEYDGEKGHSETRAISRDRKKANYLLYRGITVFRVDKYQLASAKGVYALAKQASKIMGRTFRKPTPEQWNAKCELFDCVMNRTRI